MTDAATEYRYSRPAAHGFEAIDEIKAWPIEDRRDVHTHPTQKGIRW